MLNTVLQWSAISCVVGVNIGFIFFPKNIKRLLTFALMSSILFLWYAILTQQWGMVTGQIIMGSLNIYAFIKEFKNDKLANSKRNN